MANDAPFDPRGLVEYVFYFGRLDPLAQYHHLVVVAAYKCKTAVGEHIAKVAAAVVACAVGKGHKILLLGRIAEIPGRHACPGDADFATVAFLAVLVEDFYAHAPDGVADRVCAVGKRLDVVAALVGCADGRFRRPVGVIDYYAAPDKVLDI